MHPGPPRRRPARPVADAPVDALLARSQDLTKGWLLALLEQAPLDDAPSILAADMAQQGPRVCDAVVRALASDEDLRRLEPGGALELLAAHVGVIAGASGTTATARAVDALHAVIWAGIREELARPDPEQVSQLAERLALIVELVRRAALAGEDTRGEGGQRRGSARMGPLGVVLRRAAADEEEDSERSEPTDATTEALWMGAVEDEILHAERSGSALSLLLIELEDAQRVMAAGTASETTGTFGRFAQAVRSAIRRHDILACESEGRAWVIARDTGRLGAQALGARVGRAVRDEPAWRDAPLGVFVGIAVLGEDGRDCDTLVGAAEESMFAAAASGITVVRAGDPEPGAAESE